MKKEENKVSTAKMQWLNISKALGWRKLENNLSSSGMISHLQPYAFALL